MTGSLHRAWWLAGVAVLALTACGSKPLSRAPVEDRSSVTSKPLSPPPVVPPAQPDKPLPPGSENAGKPGYYTVKPKDTLIAIGLETGQSHKDLARWNNLENPNRIEIGQVLRVVPPVADHGVAVAKPVASSSVTAAPIAAGASKPASAPASAASPTTRPAACAASAASTTPSPRCRRRRPSAARSSPASRQTKTSSRCETDPRSGN